MLKKHTWRQLTFVKTSLAGALMALLLAACDTGDVPEIPGDDPNLERGKASVSCMYLDRYPRPESHHEVVGSVDGVSLAKDGSRDVLINGWACVKNWRGSIHVHAFAGGPHNCGGRFLGGALANRASSDVIRDRCGTAGTGLQHRYAIRVPRSKLQQKDAQGRFLYRGEAIHVHALQPAELRQKEQRRNDLLRGSGLNTLGLPVHLKHFGYFKTHSPEEIAAVADHSTVVFLDGPQPMAMAAARKHNLKMMLPITGMFFDCVKKDATCNVPYPRPECAKVGCKWVPKKARTSDGRGHLDLWEKFEPTAVGYHQSGSVFAFVPIDEPEWHGVGAGYLETVAKVVRRKMPTARLAVNYWGHVTDDRAWFKGLFPSSYDYVGLEYYSGGTFPLSRLRRLLAWTRELTPAGRVPPKVYFVPAAFVKVDSEEAVKSPTLGLSAQQRATRQQWLINARLDPALRAAAWGRRSFAYLRMMNIDPKYWGAESLGWGDEYRRVVAIFPFVWRSFGRMAGVSHPALNGLRAAWRRVGRAIKIGQ
jgi:hypothetical protein